MSHLFIEIDKTYTQISACIACSKVLSFNIALTFPLLFVAQYGVVTSTFDSQASTLKIFFFI